VSTPDLETLKATHGDLHDRLPRHRGRFTADDWFVNQFVRVANRPRLLILATLTDLVGVGLVYSVVEKRGPVEGVWWAIVTGFTVGYGDSYPSTTPGRSLGAFLIVTMFVLALCLGAQITSRLIEDHDEFTHQEQVRMERKQDQILANQDRILAALAGLAAAEVPAATPVGTPRRSWVSRLSRRTWPPHQKGTSACSSASATPPSTPSSASSCSASGSSRSTS
jgi:voltage-gated potassium channel